MNIRHLPFSEALTEAGAALLARDLDSELAASKITHSEHQCLVVEQNFVREYRGRYQRDHQPVRFTRVPNEGLL